MGLAQAMIDFMNAFKTYTLVHGQVDVEDEEEEELLEQQVDNQFQLLMSLRHLVSIFKSQFVGLHTHGLVNITTFQLSENQVLMEILGHCSLKRENSVVVGVSSSLIDIKKTVEVQLLVYFSLLLFLILFRIIPDRCC